MRQSNELDTDNLLLKTTVDDINDVAGKHAIADIHGWKQHVSY